MSCLKTRPSSEPHQSRRNIKTMHGGFTLGGIEAAVVQGLDRFRKDRDCDREELGVTAQGITGAYRILSGQYHLVATNVPYLGRGKQIPVLRDFCEHHHPDTKSDLATCFVERSLGLCTADGTAALSLCRTGYSTMAIRSFANDAE